MLFTAKPPLKQTKRLFVYMLAQGGSQMTVCKSSLLPPCGSLEWNSGHQYTLTPRIIVITSVAESFCELLTANLYTGKEHSTSDLELYQMSQSQVSKCKSKSNCEK